MTGAEFTKYSAFSFEQFIHDMAKSSGRSADEIRQGAGGPPREPGPRDLWYVSEHEGNAIGYFWMQLRKDRRAFGYDIHIDEAFRGKGHGRMMMMEGRKLLKTLDVEALDVCVFDSNEIARALYFSLGFAETRHDPLRRLSHLSVSV